jgi:hypothetical protein
LTRPLLKSLIFLAPLGLFAWAGCNEGAPNPFLPDGGSTGGAGGGGGIEEPADAGPDADPTLGGPCVDDGQCNDMLPCTMDKCDQTLGRCRFTPDDSACQNALFCDGVEVCSNKLGCVAGTPVGCGDQNSCTIDTCDEPTHACLHVPRDADGDGDVDVHCPGGGDCDDADPTISSKLPEICKNQKDDNCDGMVDEASCIAPQNDTCAEPLEISVAGSYALDSAGAHFDYATSCGPGNQPGAADVVAALILPAGPPVDVELTARTQYAPISMAMAGQCGDPTSEIACGASFPAAQGGQLAKIRGRMLGSATATTALPIYLATGQSSAITLDVQILPPQPQPANETCGTADAVVIGMPFAAPILDAVKDLASACPTVLGDLVYTFTLAATSDIDVYASSADGDGLPSISLRGSGCALPADEIACQTGASPHVFRHSLAAGTYYVAVSASAPTVADVTIEASPPTAPTIDETCLGAPVLQPNKTTSVVLAGHQDDINLGCFPGAIDAAYELDLAVASDVLLVERIGSGDSGAIELSQAACAAPSDQIVCGTGGISPVRASKHNVPAGSYRVVTESFDGQDTQITAFVRPAVAPTLIPFADACADAITIPPTGGLFQGNTANAVGDFNAGCDQGGVPPGGAPDQLLKLTLVTPQRVVMDMAGSAYTTLLDVREGPGCPGTEVPMACAVGYPPGRSYLDVVLGAGTYYLQIDGLALDSGAWFLDVRVVDP